MHLDDVAPFLDELLTGSLGHLQGSNNVAKVQAMQRAIKMLLNGDQLPALFITIVRYVLPSEDHNVQKLLLLYLVRPYNGWGMSCLLLEGLRAPRCKLLTPRTTACSCCCCCCCTLGAPASLEGGGVL